MKTCAACGVENPAIAKFCLACGTPLADAGPAQEHRKVVTIVFSDLKGSTALGEALDSEALREVMTRYFDAMRAELERHGGVIEKFIGDAVMAVFGLPQLHEDDALRAVRAAAGMQAALEELNEELEEVYGVRLANRTGVNTGQVVAGDPTTGQRLVTGDAVNVAARLEQAAGEREVLIGALTYTLVRDDVEVEEVEPLELKGKSERVPAYRLVGVSSGAAAPELPKRRLVGREAELGRWSTPSTGPRRRARHSSSRSSRTPGSASHASPPSSRRARPSGPPSSRAGVSRTARASPSGPSPRRSAPTRASSTTTTRPVPSASSARSRTRPGKASPSASPRRSARRTIRFRSRSSSGPCGGSSSIWRPSVRSSS